MMLITNHFFGFTSQNRNSTSSLKIDWFKSESAIYDGKSKFVCSLKWQRDNSTLTCLSGGIWSTAAVQARLSSLSERGRAWGMCVCVCVLFFAVLHLLHHFHIHDPPETARDHLPSVIEFPNKSLIKSLLLFMNIVVNRNVCMLSLAAETPCPLHCLGFLFVWFVSNVSFE